MAWPNTLMDLGFNKAARSSPGDDLSFGPRYGNMADVTLTFSNVFFAIVPSCLLLVAAVGHLRAYSRRKTVAVRSLVLWARTATAVCILALSIASSVAWCTNTAYNTPTSIPTAVVFSLSSAAVLAMIWTEHCKSTQSSSILSTYLAVTMLLDAARARSFAMRSSLETASGLMGAVAALKFILVVLLEVRKRLTPELEARNLVGELTSGFWNRSVIAWINGLLLVGFRRCLHMSDLRNLDETFSARYLDAQFTRVWRKAPKGKRALIRTFVYLFGAEIMVACVPQVAYVACNFANVYLLRALLNYLNSPNTAESFIPGGLVAATALSYLGLTISKNMTTAMTNRAAVRIRSTVFAQVARKIMLLPISKADKSTALTHISADVENILFTVNMLPSTFVAPFYLGVALYTLYLVVGKVVSLAVIPCTLFLTFTTIMTYFVPRAQKRWNGGIDARITATTSILSQLRAIKMVGLSPSVGRHLRSMRNREIALSFRRRLLACIGWTFSPIQLFGLPLVLVAGLVFWTGQQAVIDATTMYTMFCFAYLVSEALNVNRNSWPQIASMFALFSRIQEFLLQDERHDPRVLDTPNNDKGAKSTEKGDKVLAISTSDLSVASKGDHEHHVLHNVHINVPKSTLTFLIGAVGSGKSVFLKSLLGEVALASGTIELYAVSLAWCGQLPWIPRGTIREAIVGESTFEESWYQTVVKACALEYDFTRLSEGDQSPTGTNGSSLSGGQLRRVGLARAVYSKASLLLCDDVLSALDKSTAAHIFQEVFSSNGLLRTQGRTIVLATHSIEWLDAADQIILFEEGKARSCDRSEIKMDIRQAILAQRMEEKDSSEADGTSVISQEDEPEKWDDRMSTDWSLYTFYLRGVPWYLLWPSFIGILLIGFFERSPELYFRIWLSAGPANKLYYIGLACLFAGALIVNPVAVYLFFIRTVRIISAQVYDVFVDTVMRATLPFITSTNNGALLNKFSQDMSLLAQQMPYELFFVVYVLQLVVQQTVLIVAGAQYAGLMIPGILVVVYYLQLFYLQSSRQMRLLDLESQTPLYTKITEATAGLEYIRAFRWEDEVLDRIFAFTDEAAKPCYYMYTIQRWLMLVLNGLGLIIAVILVSMAVYLSKTVSQAGLGLALASLIDYGGMVEAFVVAWTGLETSLGAVRRIKAFVTDTPTEQRNPGAEDPAPAWPSQGRVTLTGLSCAYSDRKDAPLALQNVSFTIQPGQKAIVVGRTGSGKSSLLLALLNCLHHTGSIVIDGVDITDLTYDGLRGAITTISQETINLPGTIKDNLVPEGPLGSSDLEEEELWSVLELVRLRDLIEKKEGLDTPLSGLHLSVGQKQLFDIARAIVHQRRTKGKLVLMDEVTSNMDYETDAIIQKVMDTEFAGCTRIIISHRQRTNDTYDVVVSLEDGKLVAVETWAERNQGALSVAAR